MIESADRTITAPNVGGPVRHDWRRASGPRRVPVALAIITVVLFGIGCTMLGVTAARIARPCPDGCSAVSVNRVALGLMTAGPGVVSTLSTLVTLWRTRLGRAQAWLCSVLGCVASVACVAVGSAILGIF